MEAEERFFLAKSLRLLETWLPDAGDIWLKRYEEDSRLYEISFSGPYVHCLFVIEEAGMKRLIQLVYEGETVAADCAAWIMDRTAFTDENNRRYLEEESDWEYWECEIAADRLAGIPPYRDPAVLIYTNAYTTKRYRQKGIFRNMIRETEAYVSRTVNASDIVSVISLDPDVACYGEDKMIGPYYYSMADEPARRRNAEIAGRCGFEPLKLETDEPVEDGSILWFALRHVMYVNV